MSRKKIAEMHKVKKELTAATGLRVGCGIWPPKRMLGRTLCAECGTMRRPMIMFSIHEPRGRDPYAHWIGAGYTAKEAKADFLKNLREEYKRSNFWLCKTYQTSGPQYLPSCLRGQTIKHNKEKE